MIPKLRIDHKAINANWTDKKAQKQMEEFCAVTPVGKNKIPTYSCGISFLNMGVFHKFKSYKRGEKYVYGYCDNEDALATFLQKFVDSTENYFVNIGGLDMECEKYYKWGSYIDKFGNDTGTSDYYEYLDEHPEYETEQQVPGKWIRFSVHRILTEKEK